MSITADSTALAASGVRKAFAGTQALDGVDFDVRSSEVHALLGENGAGKSTLVKIISGTLRPDVGTLEVNGERVSFHSPREATERGIAVVHQELSLMPNLTVAENLSLGSVPRRSGRLASVFDIADQTEMRRRTERASELLGTSLTASSKVGELSAAKRQLIEIGRALLRSARVLLLDEPTSSLPPDDRHELFERLKALRSQGIGIVFITHSLEEALAVADRVTVLRDGQKAGTRATAELDVDQIVELMTGREAGTVFPSRPAFDAGTTRRLVVEGLASPPLVKDVSFSVMPGEIVGLAGLVGSGRTETLKAIFGALPTPGGTMTLDGEPLTPKAPADAIKRGVALIPEDRHAEAIMAGHNVKQNIAVVAANSSRGEQVTRFRRLMLDQGAMSRLATRMVNILRIKTSGIAATAAELSGGNQQKVILARWLALSPSLVLADEPTRGVSIGSKVEIYRLLREMADQGASVVIVSSEFEELLGLCSRIILLRDGRSEAEVNAVDVDETGLLNLLLSSRKARVG